MRSITSRIKDARPAWKVMYPVREVLSLAVCGTIASGDDYDDIVDWATRTLPCCAALPNSTSAFPAPVGCAEPQSTPTCAWTVLPHGSRNAGRTSLNVGPSTATALPSLDKLTALIALYLVLVGCPELLDDLALRQLRSRGMIVRM